MSILVTECDYCDTRETLTAIFGSDKMVSNLKTIGDSKVCPECEKKGVHKIGRADNVIDINDVLRQSRDIDTSIQVRTDVFNAQTTAIIDIKRAIDMNDTITNKPFALAEELVNRLNHFKKVIFEKNQEIMEAQTNQRAIQQHMNLLANQLRSEEREKLKLQDISYKPGVVKPIKPKAVKTTAKKLDKAELRKWCSQLDVPEYMVQVKVVSSNMTVEQAAKFVRQNINEALAQIKK